ncbi:MAG TPA: hypothetical protein VGL81_30385 [Polyangiaceae bacterium]
MRPLAGIALALWLAGCGDVSAQPIGAAAGDGGAADSSAEATSLDGPAGEGASPPGDASDFCSGHGPIPLPGTDECTGDLAHLFRFAACACDSLAVSGALTTTSFDSSTDGGSSVSGGASIAANGQVATNAQSTVGGSVWAGAESLASGTPAVSLMSPAGVTSSIALDVESGGDVLVNGTFLVGHDLYADGNVTLQSGSLSVVGAVHLPAGNTANGVTSGGGVSHGPVQVPPPCDCTSPIDIVSIIATHQGSNDDAAIALATNGLDAPASPVTLPCGQYYVDGVHGGAVELDVTGRAALFVAGDLDVDGGLKVVLSPGTELDLFVAGNVELQGTTSLGDVDAPARMRLYVGGNTVTLSANATVGANVYAPSADVQLASSFEMWGAVFAQSLQFSGDFTIHYDTSVLDEPGCAPPGSPCKTCDDCAGATPACKAGTCTACLTDADCCAPLQCNSGTGRCQLPIE